MIVSVLAHPTPAPPLWSVLAGWALVAFAVVALAFAIRDVRRRGRG